ncbi:MAG TPA: glycosyltransferase family 4 protein [Candidatus Udaeobacter sp.]|nr:glycosyltransferase family 4 protein [Candidatus Udaeobacter sp.]
MRIAQVAPLIESVPPSLYGGTERVVSYLTEELVAAGHDVTLFATADSVTRARLVPCAPRALRLDRDCVDRLAHQVVMLEEVFRRLVEFDVLHFHIDYTHFPLSRLARARRITTLHGRLDIPDLIPIYREFPDEPVVSISNAQRAPLPWLNWQGTVSHGLPRDLLRFGDGRGGYLAFLGRVSPEKRLDHAIEIARRAGMPLRIAAKVDPSDRDYFHQVIEPLLREPGVEYLSEIDERGKEELLGGATAMLFPIDWPEPFGMVMIESMACGTPVIAFRRGSVPEVIDEGSTGFIVGGIEEAARAVEKARKLDRRECRRTFERRFSAARMAREYVAIYQRQLRAREAPVAVS